MPPSQHVSVDLCRGLRSVRTFAAMLVVLIMSMFSRRLLCAAALLAPLGLLASASAAKAQTSIYGMVALTDYGYKSYPGQTDLRSRGDTFGIGGGLTYFFPSSSRLKAGPDVRFAASFGNKGGEDGAAALRIAFVPHQNPLSPYFQIGGGFVSIPDAVITTALPSGYVSFSQQRVTGGTVDFAFGLNIRTSRQWAIRAVELDAQASSKVAVARLGFGAIYTLPSHKQRNP